MDRTTTTLRERVLEHVAVLRLPLTADELDTVLSTTERESPDARLTALTPPRPRAVASPAAISRRERSSSNGQTA